MDSEGDRDPNAIVQPIPYSEKAGAQCTPSGSVD